ncbi:hypothetical protein P8935_20300 [Telmatobacter sp. DSM 110680]|uniref:Holin of 3TMs, for gene-transfer release n=1 Tax=Telmatobacter sp. DSM 110680 TaxID=3036704 RepID=A0AAU7DIK0_9BACT
MVDPRKEPVSFDEIRADIEAKQRSIIWPDYLAATGRVYGFLWNGDPKAKIIPRAGLVLFGLHFFAGGIAFIAASIGGEPEDRFYPGAVIGSVFVLLALRMFRNALLFAPKPLKSEGEGEFQSDKS